MIAEVISIPVFVIAVVAIWFFVVNALQGKGAKLAKKAESSSASPSAIASPSHVTHSSPATLTSGTLNTLVITGIVIIGIIVIGVIIAVINKIVSKRKLILLIRNRLNALQKKYSKLSEYWADLTTNIENILKYPLLNDLTNSKVQSATVLLGKINSIIMAAKISPSEEYADEISDKLDEAKILIDSLHREAQIDKTTNWTEAERRDFALAQQLLATVRDTSATQSERRLSYQRVERILHSLGLNVPEKALTRLELEADLKLALAA